MSRVIIFDIDNTLLRLQQAESDAFARTFEICYGITGVNQDWKSYKLGSDKGIAIEILEEHFGRPYEESEVARIEDTFALLLRDIKPEPIAGAPAVLEALAERDGAGFALSTGNWERTAKLRLEQAGMGKYFRFGGFAEDGHGKTVTLGAALTKCRKEWPDLKSNANVVSVGDSPSDAIAARTHGTHFIGIGTDTEKFDGLEVKRIFPDYQDLKGFVEVVEGMWGV
ncbi:hypothetical protein ES703_69262 [subsurface metagenome]